MQIRHNLVVPGSPSFVGAVVSEKRHTILKGSESSGFFGNETVRIGLAVAGMAVCAAAWRRCCGRMRVTPRRAGGAGRSGAHLSDLQLNSALRNNADAWPDNIEAALAANDADLADSFVDLARDKQHCARRRARKRVSDAVTEDKLHRAFRKTLRHRARHRQCRRCREPVGHGRRRPVRVRRHQGRRARRQASGDGRGYRSAGARACRRGPRGDGGDLCLRRRRGAGARRADAGQGRPQGRAARRRPDAMGRPLGARGGRCADAADRRSRPARCCGPAQTIDRDQGGVPRREGRRAGAACQGCRPRRREGRHPRRAGHAENRRGAEGCRARRPACGVPRAARPARS